MKSRNSGRERPKAIDRRMLVRDCPYRGGKGGLEDEKEDSLGDWRKGKPGKRDL